MYFRHQKMYKEEVSNENTLYKLKQYQTKKIERIKENTYVNTVIQNSIGTLKGIQDLVMSKGRGELE